MPPQDKLELADVARLAGVSPATASRALSNAYGVSPATRARVLEVAERVNYVVSPEASGLARGTRQRVALVVPHIERWFFGAMVSGLGSVLRAAGFDVLLYHVGDSEDRSRFFEQLPARRKVDAVVVVAFPVADEERARLELMGVTVVAAGGQNAAYPFVCIDDHAAARQAVDHLLQLRHTRIGMIGARDPAWPNWPVRPGRIQAYYDCLEAAGIEVDPALISTVDWGPEHGAEGMARLLSLREPPTAVYAHSDEIAFGAMSVLRRAGLRVPQDMSIVAIDDHPLSAFLDLTTVAQPVPEQGKLTAQMLLALLRGEETDQAMHVPTKLVVRGSTTRLRSAEENTGANM
ncbi:LacI family transcriptional regulator [Nocardioides gansuensis]|uniref:LacI family transcriptional regulator n=1 Tax=Nocardioides gansuensis TaxID=2138300 RepID=A0A2T8F6G2_9ACTN|nr:LacI family DNA-binding transcriptional regulator [Nocardioides gansuensis]PVG81302.1 LacI family transcriptional regulator [Nocardioides gansuensis]